MDTLAHARGSLTVNSMAPDERRVLVSNWKLDQRWDPGRVDVETGVQEIGTWIGGAPDRVMAKLSPDGRWMA